MKKELQEAWIKAEQTGKPVDIGSMVVCDYCDEDFTESQEQGGLIFQSKAICPKCAVKARQDIRRYGENGFIRATCPDGKAFADFVREYRGDNSTVSIKIF